LVLPRVSHWDGVKFSELQSWELRSEPPFALDEIPGKEKKIFRLLKLKFSPARPML
jgi:hypothetical protein